MKKKEIKKHLQIHIKSYIITRQHFRNPAQLQQGGDSMVKVNITGLYNLVEKKIYVEPRFILNEAKAWYDGIKLEGSKHVLLFYEDENGDRVEKRCPEVNIKVRAMAAFVAKLYYRWDDDNSMRLEHHYDLPLKISDILEMKKLTKDDGHDYKFITIRKLIENYLS